ncbi:MAG: carbon starvation protein A [Clostridia bacterium]|nr:carbon starvation protein A [Clostridia bacterium]
MNGFLILVIAIVLFIVAYVTYGAWLCKKWGIDPTRKTPAVEKNDGGDYVPANPAVLLGHHFSSIAGAGPITGPIQAAFFGWVPVLLWVVIGGIFFGGVQDFSALFASIRHDGKTIGEVIEHHIGRKCKLIFNIFCFLVLLLVVAAFGDIVANTFASVPATVDTVAYTVDGVLNEEAYQAACDAATAAASSAGSVATASLCFIPLAILFGLLQRKNNNTLVNTIIGVILLCGSIWLGLRFPMMNVAKSTWTYVVLAYIFIASVAPVWILLQPRDYLNSFLLYAIIILAVVGIAAARPTMVLPAFNGFVVNGQPLFPVLFITIACGAISGFHSLIASGTTSKQLANEGQAKVVGYGAMLIECTLAVITLVAVGSAVGQDMKAAGATPAGIFANGIASFAATVGLPTATTATVIALAYSAFCLTSLDTATRLGRMIFQEIFDGTKLGDLLANKYLATVVTIGLSFLLMQAGYSNIWPLFGAANQLVSVPAFMALAVWFKHMGKGNKMFLIPMFFMMVATLSSLGLSFYNNVMKLSAGTGIFAKEGLQCIIIVPLIILAIIIVVDGLKELAKKKAA